MSVPLRIGMVVPRLGFAGGLERHAWELARSLRERGHEVVLLHGEKQGREPVEYAAAFTSCRPVKLAGRTPLDVVWVHKASSVEELAPLGDVPAIVASHDHDLSCVRRHRYLPVTHAPCHRAPGMACVAFGCVVVRRREDGQLPFELRNPFALVPRLAALARRAPLAACSAYLAARLVDAGAPPGRVHVVHPISPDPECPVKPAPKSRRALYVGQLFTGKGVDLAIRALALLPRAVTLDVLGEGPSRAALERLAATVVPGRVRFLGYLPPADVDAVYDLAAVVVVPSVWPEPFGMVGIEAMRRARPVVGANHGGIPEWLAEGVSGRLFRPGDAPDLARALTEVLDDPGAGERALLHVRASFNHASTVGRVEALLRSVATRPVEARPGLPAEPDPH